MLGLQDAKFHGVAAVGLAAGLDLIEGWATVLGALRSGALAVRGPAGALLAAGRAADW